MQHYFIGIKVPTLFETYVEEIRNKYRLREAYKAIPHIEDLHITLIYIGPLEENKVTIIEEKLSIIAALHSKFTLSVDGVSFFGSNSTPRVIYLSVENHPELSRLQRDVANSIEEVMNQPLDNRFTPHITIAKKWKGVDDFSFKKEKREPMEVPVDSFSLFAIHPKEKPMYDAVRSFNLE